MFDLTLAFDNGPEPEVTPRVVETLGRRGIRATFFLMGRKLAAPEGRETAAATRAAGHWLGNHTWSHGRPLGDGSGRETALAEIVRTQETLGDLSHPDRLFRPNAGGKIGPNLLSREAAEVLCEGGYTCVLWNAVAHDWSQPEGWVERALDQCAQRPWTSLALHDLPTGAMDDLGRFLDAVLERGGRFRQEFPPDTVPIVRGVPALPLDPYMPG
jgi:peptidoglycan/xylan/chitin deacetylase (PgdA/CDA1 family)